MSFYSFSFDTFPHLLFLICSLISNLKREYGDRDEADNERVEHHWLVELQVPDHHHILTMLVNDGDDGRLNDGDHYDDDRPDREHDGEVDGEETGDAVLVENPHRGQTK